MAPDAPLGGGEEREIPPVHVLEACVFQTWCLAFCMSELTYLMLTLEGSYSDATLQVRTLECP